jgi:cysteine-rich repeat protein
MKYSGFILFFFALALLFYGCESDDSSEKQDPATGADSGSDAGAVKDASQPVKQCTGDQECSDGLFCNGEERCMPGTAGADEKGCVSASSGPCEKQENCDEKLRECLPCAGNADIDGDNHDAVACGGDDCDDNDRHRFPGYPEVCDEEHHDEDCNPDTFGFKDLDNDGAADENCCNRDDEGKLLCGTDCDDTTFTVHPDQLEICDGKDNNCNGEVDEETNEVPWYPDNDNDNYGVETDDAPLSCAPVEGHTIKKDDCDDDDASRHPAQIDLCDQVDNNCNGVEDEDVGCDIEVNDEVGAEGGDIGQVVNATNVLGLQIPKEALTEDVEIGIKQVQMPSELPATAEAVGPTYEFTPHGLRFSKQVELHLPFVAADTENLAVMRRRAEDDSPWERLEGVSFRDSVASVKLDSLSYFQVVRVIEGQVQMDGGAEADAGVMDGGEPVCGNGVVEGEEQCDDGNDDDDDGCTRKCKYSCEDDDDCDDGNSCNGEEVCDDHVCDDSDPDLDDGESCGDGKECVDGECEELCGNGVVDSGEDCDDGDNDDDDGCTRDCEYTIATTTTRATARRFALMTTSAMIRTRILLMERTVESA